MAELYCEMAEAMSKGRVGFESAPSRSHQQRVAGIMVAPAGIDTALQEIRALAAARVER